MQRGQSVCQSVVSIERCVLHAVSDMAFDLLSSIHTLAVSIVNSAQPSWDGGVVAFFLDKVLFQNASEKQPPQQHFISTINSGGYRAGLACGILWALILLLCGLWLLIMHCRRKSTSKSIRMYSMLANRIQYRNSSFRRRWQCVALQSILSVLLVLLAIVFCILGFVINSHLNSSLTSKTDENAVTPQVSAALRNVKSYVDLLAPHARIATKPIVDEIVYDTEKLQNDSKAVFTIALTKEMSGDVLQRQGKMLIQYFDVLFTSMNAIQEAQELTSSQKVDSEVDDARKKVAELCSDLRTKGPSFGPLCDALQRALGIGPKLLNIDFPKVRLREAGTFVGLLTQYKQTPEFMKKKWRETLAKKKAMEDKMYIKSKKVLRVEETIRNMTNVQWDDLEVKLQGASEMLENLTLRFNGDMHAKMSKYEGARNAVYVLVLLLLLVIGVLCAVVCIHHFCFPGDLTRRVRNSSKVALYCLMMALAVAVLISCATFLIGGYAQTEVCRYLEQRPTGATNSSELLLDKVVNDFLDRNWEQIEALAGNDSSMPMPRPRDIFDGVWTTCRANQSIMLAIHGIEGMDLTKVSKPQMTERFLRLGRKLMHEGFLEANPDDFLRPTMKKDMADLLSMADKFIVKSNYSAYIDELSKPLTRHDVSTVAFRLNALLRACKAATAGNDRMLDIYGQLYSLNRSWLSVLTEMKKLKGAVQSELKAFVQVRNYMNLSDVVNPMMPAIDQLARFVKNKTFWIEEADKLYDQIIVKRSYESSPALMAKSTRQIMGVLGPCRHIYNALSHLVFASCSGVVQPLNLLWLFLGTAILFLTPVVVIALLLLTKTMGLEKGDYPASNGAPTAGDQEMVSVREDSEESKVPMA